MTGPAAHHELGASAAYRWLTCTDSPAAQRDVKDKESTFAREGTLAHELGELNLRAWKGEIVADALKSWAKTVKAEGFDNVEMLREVDKYTQYVRDYCEDDKDRLLVEVRVGFGDLIPGGFGTGDALVITREKGVLTRVDVIDLKYGRGKRVDAENNPQLRLYGYGAVEYLKEQGLFDPDLDDPDMIDVGLHIVQPRLDHFDKETIFLSDLFAWADETVRPVVASIEAGDTKRVAGSHCDFCRVQATCKARAEQVAASLDTDFDDFIEDGPDTAAPGTLTPEQVAKVLDHKADVEKWFNAVKEYAYSEIEAGRKIPGHKLVAGRRSRKWSDDDKVLELFKGQRALKQDDYAPRKLITPAAADKVLPKNSKIRDEIVSSTGKPTLVAESHKSPALVFDDLENDFD